MIWETLNDLINGVPSYWQPNADDGLQPATTNYLKKLIIEHPFVACHYDSNWIDNRLLQAKC